MKIEFPEDKGAYSGVDPAIHFTARVDGDAVLCTVTAEALEDHFGAKSAYEWDLLEAFAKGLTRIHEVAERALRSTGGRPVVLHSGMFRLDISGGA